MASHNHRPGLLGLLCIAAVLALPLSAASQQTRVEEHERAQAVKATIATAPTVGSFERAIRKVKSFGLLGGSPSGVYPQVTTVYPGGWLAFGGGYRRPFGDTAAFDVNTAWSLRNFKKVDTSFTVPPLLHHNIALEFEGQWIDAPSVAFYGVGNETRADDRTTFAYRPTTVGLTATTTTWDIAAFGGGADYVVIDTVSFEGPATAVELMSGSSGLTHGPRYLRSRGFAAIDWRRIPGYTGSGGLYRVEVQDHSDRSGSHLGFRSLEAEVVQLVPIRRANWVIALRGLTTITDDRDGDDVPFYLMPSIGGNSSVRGYPSFRFRDNHRLLLSAEYRWTATRFLDMAIFYDAGKVAADVDQLNLRGLKSAYGIGARFHGTKRTVFRIEAARNDERAWRFVWSTGAAF